MNEILEQGSFNIINGFDYHKLLTAKTGNMMEARKNWQTIGNIKNFKEGYLSQVVNKIYNLVLKHSALVILEDLNTEFKAKRTALVEKSVYKKFELAVAKKFNYLVLKDKKLTEIGGALYGYQLTPYIGAGEVSKFEKSREWGIMKYVTASYTSTTDPLTGWYKNIYLKTDTREKMRDSILKFQEIVWDIEYKSFKFKYNPQDFVKDKNTKVQDKNWTIYSCVDRIRNLKNDKNVWLPQKYYHNTENSITIKLSELFKKYEINTSKEIVEQISQNLELPSEFYNQLIWNLNLILQIRNSETGTDIDFIQSPIKPFFDSRHPENFGKKLDNGSWTVPENGDANGAYHIAKRGLEFVTEQK